MSQTILGFHHVTAFCGDPQRAIDFFARVLGLRMIKVTVNYDEPSVYHLYFADARGTPGTVYTLFPWPATQPGTPGLGQLVTTVYRVPPGALDHWRERLNLAEIEHETIERHGEPSLHFYQNDGLAFELIEIADERWHAPREDDDRADAIEPWTTSGVPRSLALREVARVVLAVPDVERTASVFAEVLGLEPLEHDTSTATARLRFPVGEHRETRIDEPLIELHTPDGLGGGRYGPGVVHHLALAVRDTAALKRWRVHLDNAGFNVTDVRERQYFRSIYFREPGGVLMELATRGPGFLVDESREALGRSLMLPPWLEPRRSELARRLPPLILPHRDVSPAHDR